jgi:hypothetical protein
MSIANEAANVVLLDMELTDLDLVDGDPKIKI